MNNELLLKLESGQKLRILPFDNNDLFKKYHFIFNDKIGLSIVDNTSIMFSKHIQKTIQYYYLVEYNNKLYITRSGYRINEKIKQYFYNDTGNSSYNTNYLFKYNVCLNVFIKKVQQFDDFDDSFICTYNDDTFSNYSIDTFFETDEYKNIINDFYNYINNLKLENKSNIIKIAKDNDFLVGNYEYLFRSIKINEIRSRKITITKNNLWNKVSDIINNNKNIEDIGYDKDSDIHQFMIDGYLFEIKLLDKV
jgi:hypothetical protein